MSQTRDSSATQLLKWAVIAFVLAAAFPLGLAAWVAYVQHAPYPRGLGAPDDPGWGKLTVPDVSTIPSATSLAEPSDSLLVVVTADEIVVDDRRIVYGHLRDISAGEFRPGPDMEAPPPETPWWKAALESYVEARAADAFFDELESTVGRIEPAKRSVVLGLDDGRVPTDSTDSLRLQPLSEYVTPIVTREKNLASYKKLRFELGAVLAVEPGVPAFTVLQVVFSLSQAQIETNALMVVHHGDLRTVELPRFKLAGACDPEAWGGSPCAALVAYVLDDGAWLYPYPGHTRTICDQLYPNHDEPRFDWHYRPIWRPPGCGEGSRRSPRRPTFGGRQFAFDDEEPCEHAKVAVSKARSPRFDDTVGWLIGLREVPGVSTVSFQLLKLPANIETCDLDDHFTAARQEADAKRAADGVSEDQDGTR